MSGEPMSDLTTVEKPREERPPRDWILTLGIRLRQLEAERTLILEILAVHGIRLTSPHRLTVEIPSLDTADYGVEQIESSLGSPTSAPRADAGESGG